MFVRCRGSSPLTRGKLAADEGLASHKRLIPAHAGKTRCPRPPASPSAAHPRSRGENFPDRDVATAVSGSSPLTRGKR